MYRTGNLPSRQESYRYATSTKSGAKSGSKQTQAVSKLEDPYVTEHTTKADKEAVLNELRQELDMDEHRIPIDELYARFESDPNRGLASQTALSARERDGPNVLNPPDAVPIWIRVAGLFFGGLNLLLWMGAIMAFVQFLVQIGEYPNLQLDSLWLCLLWIGVAVILGVFNCVVDFISTWMVKQVDHYLPQVCTVLRDGVRQRVRAEDLAIGDVVELKAGDRVAADMRIISSNGLKVDNSQLTGEAEPLLRTPEFTNENPLETRNLVFFSTNVVEGTARAIVIFTGDQTVVGRIANLASQQELSDTHASNEITHYIMFVAGIGIVLGAIWFFFAFLINYVWLEVIYIFVGMVFAWVPEALASVITMALAVSARRMLQRNVLVRNLESIVDLSAVSAVFTHKTGVLTGARMLVAHLLLDGRVIEADTTPEQNKAEAYRNNPTFKTVLHTMALCNRSEFSDAHEANVLRRECTGDPTDAAFLRFAELSMGATGNAVADLRSRSSKICEVPFNPYFKFHVSLYKTDDDPRFCVMIKGAPEKILERCASLMVEGVEYALDDRWREAFWRMFMEVGDAGERIVAFADKRLDPAEFPPEYTFDADELNFPLVGLRFLGAVALYDPPRPGVQRAVEKARAASVRVIMLTGEHPITAKAIAKQVGIIPSTSPTVEDVANRHHIAVKDMTADMMREVTAVVLNASEIRDLTPSMVEHALSAHRDVVFARVSPQQKITVVDAARRMGYIVASTGDSVYDSTSIRRANVGMALGNLSVDVCKRSADMLIADDSFASVVCAIEEGRLIFDNLRKATAYTITNKVPEAAAFLLFLVAEIPIAISTLTILYLDIIVDLLPPIALAFETGEPDLMSRPPRNVNQDKMINRPMVGYSYMQMGIMETFAGFFTYIIAMSEAGFWPFRLMDLRQEWDSIAINDVEDSYGQEWSYWQRHNLNYAVNIAFLGAILITQWVNVILVRARRCSSFQIGILNNHYLTGALVIETAMALWLAYMPFIQHGFRVYPIRFTWWLPALPWALFMLLFDEIRKFLVSSVFSGTFLERESSF